MKEATFSIAVTSACNTVLVYRLAEVNGFIVIQVSSVDTFPKVKSCTYCFIDFGAVGVAGYVIFGFTNLFVNIFGGDVYEEALVDAEVRRDFVLG